MGHLNFQCVRSEGEPFPQASDQGTPLTVFVSACKAALVREDGREGLYDRAGLPDPHYDPRRLVKTEGGPAIWALIYPLCENEL